MNKTIAQTKIEEMKSEGHELIGKTSGWLSFRKGSNLSKAIESLGKTQADVIVKTGARAGKYKNDGSELLIFSK